MPIDFDGQRRRIDLCYRERVARARGEGLPVVQGKNCVRPRCAPRQRAAARRISGALSFTSAFTDLDIARQIAAALDFRRLPSCRHAPTPTGSGPADSRRAPDRPYPPRSEPRVVSRRTLQTRRAATRLEASRRPRRGRPAATHAASLRRRDGGANPQAVESSVVSVSDGAARVTPGSARRASA